MRLLLLIFFVLIFLSCRKEETTWDTDVTLPLFNGELKLDDIIADSLLSADETGLWSLIYKGDLVDFDFDSLAQLPDTTVSESFKVPFQSGSLSLPAGVSIINIDRDITFSTSNGVQLKYVRMKSGTLKYRVLSYISGEMTSVISLPGLINAGSPLVITADTPPEVGGAPGISQGQYPLDDFEFDLRGETGTSHNRVFADVLVSVSQQATQPALIQGQDSVVVELTFEDAVVEYARGYFGQHTYTINEEETFLDGLNMPEGQLQLERAAFKIDITNNTGVDARLNLNSATSNAATSSVQLNFAPFNQPLLITRAFENNQVIFPSNSSYDLNESNSNLPDWLEILPTTVGIQGSIELNPLGNVSGSNDFIYTDRPLDLNYEVNIPLLLSASEIVLNDTLELGVDIDEDFFGTLDIVVTNEYPFSIFLDLFFLNEITNAQTVFIQDQEVRAGIQELNSSTVNAVTSVVSIPVNKGVLEKLRSDHRLILQGRLSTPGFPQPVGLYTHYTMRYAAQLNGKYGVSIR